MASTLVPKENRFVLFPIEYPDIWKFYKSAIACLWTPEEINTSTDLSDWNRKLDRSERHLVCTILGFFAASDGIVLENLILNFCKEIEIMEARCFYTFQAFMEAIHSEVYSLFIETYMTDAGEKERLLNAIQTFPSVKKKSDWALKFLDEKKCNFAERLLAFCVVEGIFFSTSFAIIFWFKSRNLLPALCQSNEFISRDEAMHVDFACLLFNNYVTEKPSRDTVIQIVTEAVEIEKEFFGEALPQQRCRDMTCKDMNLYVEYVADRLLTQLKYDKHYHAENPFEFMHMISLEGKTNFFERRLTEYKRSGITNQAYENEIDLDCEF